MSAPIDRLAVSTYTVPTDAPESDGTLEWDATTMVLVEAAAGDETGLGYAYTHRAAAVLVRDLLAPLVEGRDAMDVAGAWHVMLRRVRNIGGTGIAASAVSAVDGALWDLKARFLGLPLVKLLGQVREGVPAYGSGGFTSYSDERLTEQLGGWAEAGFRFVKMKIGREPDRDLERIRLAYDAIGPNTDLFIDANGAFTRKQALQLADDAAAYDVAWFEEPVSSDDLEGLRLLRDRGPPGMAIAAGEYGYGAVDFRRMLAAGAVDVLQADATRCLGISGFLEAAALCAAEPVPLSAHTAPALHLHPCAALGPVVHIEYFHDHVRIERMFFDGVAEPEGGMLRPDLSRPGHGLELRRDDADPYRVD